MKFLNIFIVFIEPYHFEMKANIDSSFILKLLYQEIKINVDKI